MEVSHVDDMTTHIVMSNQKSMAVTILDSPELMTLLSGALYKNPAYAMVREVICNAQDAHIEAGIPDTPIDIELTDTRLIIRDYGKGIPHENMAEVYGTYGLSTKKKQKGATGGFGLGSKSPWSFTDIFGVTSHNNGTKTVYRLLRADVENEGKPGIVPLVSIPSSETGLEVSIPLGSFNVFEMHEYIKEVILLGDIPAKLNGKLLETIPFNNAKKGFTIVNTKMHRFNTTVSIRYGSVIYPLERHEGYQTELQRLLNTVAIKFDYRYSAQIVLHAKPDTLSVAPSRDHLTLEKRTISAIKGMLNSFTDYMSTFVDYKQDVLSHYKDKTFTDLGLNYAQSKKEYAIMFGKMFFEDELKAQKKQTTIDDYFAEHKISNNKLYKSLSNITHEKFKKTGTISWIMRYCYSELLKWKDSVEPSVSIRLFNPSQELLVDMSALDGRKDLWRSTGDISDTCSLARRTVVLTTKQADLVKRIPDIHSRPSLFWVITARSRKPDVYKHLENSLIAKGFDVLNLVELEWAEPKPRTKKAKVTKEPVPVIYWPLKYSINHAKGTMSRLNSRKACAVGITNPIAYMSEKDDLGRRLLRVGLYRQNLEFLKELPVDIAIVSAKQAELLAKKGVPHFFDYLVQYYNNWISTNKETLIKFNHINTLIAAYAYGGTIRKFLASPAFSSAMKTVSIPDYSATEKQVETYQSRFLNPLAKSIPAFSGLLELPKSRYVIPKRIKDLLVKLSNSPYLSAIDPSGVSSIDDPKVAKKLIDILIDYTPKEHINDN